MTLEKALVLAVTALAGVIVYLFKLYVSQSKSARDAEITQVRERDAWILRETVIHADHKRAVEKLEEDKHRELEEQQHEHELRVAEQRTEWEKQKREILERYDQAARRESEIFRAHEDSVRKEFASIMERVAEEHGKSSAALVQLMNKFYDRLVAPRGRGSGY